MVSDLCIQATERRLLRLAKSEAKKKSHRLMWTGVDHQRKIDEQSGYAIKIQAVFRGHMQRTNETSELAQRKAERAKVRCTWLVIPYIF